MYIIPDNGEEKKLDPADIWNRKLNAINVKVCHFHGIFAGNKKGRNFEFNFLQFSLSFLDFTKRGWVVSSLFFIISLKIYEGWKLNGDRRVLMNYALKRGRGGGCS